MRSRFTTSRLTVVILLPAALAVMLTSPVAAVELTQTCTNPDDGYTVPLPRGWYWNERVEGGDINDVAACRFFSPSDFEIRPASQAADVAIGIGRETSLPPDEGEPTTVDGRPALIIESEPTGDSFDPAGTRYYQYWIEMGADWLVATTSDGPTWAGDFDENRAVLDAMMDELRFGSTASLPDTAITGSANPGLIAAGMALILLAMASTSRPVRREA